jgi:hypothetical protein
MAISLYDATVAGYLQALGGLSQVLEKGQAHAVETGADVEDLAATRLFPDMLPLTFQIWSVRHHSLGAIEGCKTGTFRPPPAMPDLDYAGLRSVVAETLATLAEVAPSEVDALEGRDVVFHLGEMKLPFTAEGFLFSFSLPNFYFHATTAYDILRSKGVKLGKRDYLGKLRLKV